MNVPPVKLKLRGRTIRLSAPRRLIGDLVHFAQRVPTVPVQRLINVSQLAEIRRQTSPRIGWCTLFTKAFARVCCAMPVLRRTYLRYPWRRLYEHPYSVASVAFERDFEGEPGVFFVHLRRTENLSLTALEKTLQEFQTAPVHEAFRFPLQISRLPQFVRRALWWWVMDVRGKYKAKFLGTFGVSVYSALGAESLHQLSPLSCALSYGVIGRDGIVPVRIVYDHRVMDGATVARALEALDNVLNTEIIAELRQLEPATAS